MDYLGLIGSYPTKRLLIDEERSRQLDQKRRLNVEPHYQLSVIKMNSCYLESVDKWYAWKGLLTAVGSIVASIFLYGIFSVGFGSGDPVWNEINKDEQIEEICFILAICVLSFPLIWLGIWLICKESFAYTHYPIRFNRETKMVYVFRANGSILSVPWDQIFFCLGNLKKWDEWEIRGHVLDSDRITVIETFVLSYVGSLSAADAAPEAAHYSSKDFVRAHWEFVRRFMEEGPQTVSNQVQYCMPVDGRRESVKVSFERILANFANAPLVIYCLMFPFCLVVGIFRVMAMRTSRVPQWPHDVESTCMVKPDDPYAIEGTTDGKRKAVFPEAALAAGVGLCLASGASKSRKSAAGGT